VNGGAISEGDDSKIPPAEFRHHTPEANPVVLLRLNSDRVLDDGDTPVPAKVWPLTEHFAFEVGSEPILRHHST
jgi:hypothetical protein